MPFYLVPGDLLLLVPLYLTDPDANTEMAVTAANGGRVPWQAGLATPIGRFQFVLGREIGTACGTDRAAEIWEWVGYTREDEGPTDGTMHGKFAVFDRQASVVGSHNLDPRSEMLNSETALVFENQALSTELARLIYEHDLAYCRPVTPEIAATFNDPKEALYKLRKSFGDLFERQL